MENTNENKEMTARESLSLITETLNNSRKDITRRSAKHFLLWGALLVFFSLLIYLLCKMTDKGAWNYLWFAMPAIGFPLARLLGRKDETANVQNDVSRIVGGIWAAYAVFACVVAAFTYLFSQFSTHTISVITSIFSLTAELVLLFGLAECVTGVALKNWVIKIAGVVTGIGGIVIYYMVGLNEEQLLIFTFAGLVLLATGLIVKRQYK